jgi:ribose 5-phosphate isomerase B
MALRIALASDHAGFEQKEQLVSWLREQGCEVDNFGSYGADERVDYPDFAAAVAKEVAAGTVDFGILVCGTGIGMAIAANKLAGIRAANITTPELAALAREHNDANILTLSGRFVDLHTNELIIKAFLETPFAAGRHADRIAKITALEQAGTRQDDDGFTPGLAAGMAAAAFGFHM